MALYLSFPSLRVRRCGGPLSSSMQSVVRIWTECFYLCGD